MLLKSEADRASAQAAKARRDAGEAGTSVAAGARNLGAAVLATLAEVTAPEDDRKGKRHAQRARAKAVKAARRDREAVAKAATKAAAHGRKAAEHGRAAADKRAKKGKSGGSIATLAGAKAVGAASSAAGTAKLARSQMANKVSSSEVTGKARARAAKARDTAASVRESAVQRAAERSGPLADSARERAAAGAAVLAALAAAAREKSDESRARALLGVDQDVDIAVPREQDGVAVVGVRADQLRDVIHEELLPKIQEMLADLQTSGDGRRSKDDGAAAVMDAKPRKKKRRKGGVLIALGLLTAIGAGVAWYLDRQQRQGAKDPWASQAGGADPWASRTPTSAGDPSAEASVGATAATTAVTPTAPAASTTGASGIGSDVSGEGPRMLESEEIDALASDTPSTADDQAPGESPTEEIETARREAGPAVTDTPAGQADEGTDPGRAARG